MPNITVYLNNETYWKFFLLEEDRQKEIRQKCQNIFDEETKDVEFFNKRVFKDE